MDFHPLANIFPLIEGTEFEKFVEDVRLHGVLEPIWTHEGTFEGRHRYRAAAVAGVPCPTRPYEGDDPVAFVISMNFRRRHLDKLQRAMVAAKLATLPKGSNQHAPNGAPSQDKAAELLNVARRSVQRAREVQERGAAELVSAVERGAVSVSAAADVASLPLDKQRELLAGFNIGLILDASKQVRAEKAEARYAARDAKLVALSRVDAPFPERRFPVILADPPYRYERKWSVSRDIDVNHYPTMATEEICALPVADLATPDAMLFLWTPAPLLTDALAIMKAWNFEFVTNAVWVKDKIGMGVYLRQQHELLLIGKRGTAIVPAPGNLSSSVIQAARREHSKKPDEAYELIERMYPSLPKIELFARGPREGFAAWGNEVPAQQRSA